MSQKLPIFVLVLVFLITPLGVSAQTLNTRTSTGSAIPLKNTNDALMRKTPAATLSANQEKMMAFKEKINGIQDARKKTLVTRINSNIANNNKKLTGKMTEALARMSSIISNIKGKAQTFKAAGNNTVALDSAIASAETAISSAQAAVLAQSQKEYTANITTDATLRTTIGQMFSQFRQDIIATYQKVVAAKQAVMKAVMEAAKLNGENAATNSAALE